MITSTIATAQVNWMSMNDALAAQEKEPRKILLKIYTQTCPNCKWMDKHAFAKAEIAQFINTNYYPVKFDAEGKQPITYKGKNYGNKDYKKYPGAQHEFAESMQIFEYPTLLFFDEEGNLINPVPGKMGPKKLEIYITMLADDTYKSIRTGKDWADYQDDFKYQLQD
jgi:thioredoxin-related protein